MKKREDAPGTWTRALRSRRACAEAVAWAKSYDSFAAAWADCPRGDWMLWIAAEVAVPNSDEHRAVVLAACACARLTLKHVERGEKRPLHAIETAERWARQEQGITLEMVRAAAAAAAAAACPQRAAEAVAQDRLRDLGWRLNSAGAGRRRGNKSGNAVGGAP
jgi:hypothetical protein